MLFSFVPDKARPLHPRPYLIPSIYLTCIAASTLPPGKIRGLLGAGALAFWLIQIPKYTQGSIAEDNLLPIQAGLLLLHWMDFFVLHSPNEFFRLRDPQQGLHQTFWEKLSWNFDLCTSMRGVGWNWKVKNVPAVENQTPRWSFVKLSALRAFRNYMLFDVCHCIILCTSYNSKSPPDIFSDGIARQILFGWLPNIGSYAALNMQYSIFAALTVAISLYTPQDWPPLMGGLDTFTTIRETWGKFWHQLLRRRLNLPFQTLIRYVPIKQGTLASRYLQLYLAFIASALIHHLGVLNVTSSTPQNDMNSLIFFLIQPLAITLEDFAVYLGKKAGVKSSWKTKILRTICTLAWFSYSFRYLSAYFYNTGLFGESPVPSLLNWIWELTSRASGAHALHEL